MCVITALNVVNVDLFVQDTRNNLEREELWVLCFVMSIKVICQATVRSAIYFLIICAYLDNQ